MGLSDNQNCLEFAKVLATTLEANDPYTSGHSERVCYYSDVISRKLSLSPKDRTELQIAAYLHDIGKIGISDRFVNKKETLNSTDWALIRQHTQKSIELLAPLKLSANIVSYIQYHHEHYDGTGYPTDGLCGSIHPERPGSHSVWHCDSVGKKIFEMAKPLALSLVEAHFPKCMCPACAPVSARRGGFKENLCCKS